MNLKYLTDKQLLADTKLLAMEDRKITAKLLHHIKEVEVRKLFVEVGHTSLFNYVVQELGFSEGSASRRISSARLLKDLPEIEKKIEDGSLTLSNLSKAADKFKQENIQDKGFKMEVLEAIENSSARTCEKTLSEIINPSSLPIQPERHFHIINVSVSEETYDKYEDIKDLLAHKRLSKDEMFKKIFESAISHIERFKFKTESTRTTTSANPRYITAEMKKAVFLRDKICQKCGSKNALEFDHIKPYALGGKSEIKNLRILCRNCNQRQRMTSNLHFP